MTLGRWALLAAGCVLMVYGVVIGALVWLGRREAARAVAGFIPDCLVVTRRLLADPRVPRRHRVLLGALVLYLALPFDVVPDFIPVAGQLDDALVVAVVLRVVLRAGGSAVLSELWPGPERSLAVVLSLAGMSLPPASAQAGSGATSRRATRAGRSAP